jgi:hypothetical protein
LSWKLRRDKAFLGFKVKYPSNFCKNPLRFKRESLEYAPCSALLTRRFRKGSGFLIEAMI